MVDSDTEKQLTPKMHGVEEKGPHRVTNDEIYRRSTQYRFWSFDEDKIEDLRVTVNRRGQEVFENRVSELDDDADALIKKYISESFSPISVEEERLIVVYYARKCKDLANFFKFTTQVRLTAISFLLKFYLVHSIMEYYPQQIMYTCLFLSAKSENNFIGINNFSKTIPKTTPESILKYEYTILETMRFSLMCHHPMRPLYGFYLDIQNVLTKLDFNRLYKDYLACRERINESVFSDVQFLYTPPQIALAALYIVDDVVCMRYLMRKFGVKRKQMLEKMGHGDKDKENQKTENGETVEKKELLAEVIKEETPVNEQKDAATIVDKGEENSPDEAEAKKVEKKHTPLERYEKMIGLIKECSVKMQEKVDPTVEEAKVISLRAHFCLDPVKYFKKLTTTPPPATTTPAEDAGVKRENPDQDDAEREAVKRVKVT